MLGVALTRRHQLVRLPLAHVQQLRNVERRARVHEGVPERLDCAPQSDVAREAAQPYQRHALELPGLTALRVVAAALVDGAGQAPAVAVRPETQVELEDAFTRRLDRVAHPAHEVLEVRRIRDRLIAVRHPGSLVHSEQFEVRREPDLATSELAERPNRPPARRARGESWRAVTCLQLPLGQRRRLADDDLGEVGQLVREVDEVGAPADVPQVDAEQFAILEGVERGDVGRSAVRRGGASAPRVAGPGAYSRRGWDGR